MTPFPHHYAVSLKNAATGATLAAPPRPAIAGGAPPEFGGSAEWWSPEHLLLSAASLCLMTTFQALAKRAELGVHGYSATVDGTLDKTKEGLVFTAISHKVKIVVGPGQIAKTQEVIASAKKHCIVSNSLKTPVTVEADVVTG